MTEGRDCDSSLGDVFARRFPARGTKHGLVRGLRTSWDELGCRRRYVTRYFARDATRDPRQERDLIVPALRNAISRPEIDC